MASMLRRVRPTPVVPPTELFDLHSSRSPTFYSPSKAESSPRLPQSLVTTPTSDHFPESIPPDTINQSTEHLTLPAPNDDATVYPAPLPLAILVLGISLTAFLVALDRTIVATGKPPLIWGLSPAHLHRKHTLITKRNENGIHHIKAKLMMVGIG